MSQETIFEDTAIIKKYPVLPVRFKKKKKKRVTYTDVFSCEWESTEFSVTK